MSAVAGRPNAALAAGAATRSRLLLERLGFGSASADARFGWRVILALLLLYLVFFAFFYPDTPTNDDEAQYLRQSVLLLEGRSTITFVDPLTGKEYEKTPSTYSMGAPLLMAPFVKLFGIEGAYLVPLLSLLIAAALTARWLQDEGRSPAFAAVFLGFPATLVMGRVCMSDMPSAAVVALGLWLFWRGQERAAPWWLGSGFVAGASLLLRVSNSLIFAPLFLGTVLRREPRCWALVVGGLAGLAVRLAGMYAYFGDPFFERGYYDFAPETIMERLPLFLMGLLILVPGGLLLAIAYRGRRRPEVIATVLGFICFYLFQTFSSVETSPSKRLILGLRYLIPLLPLLCFAMAESLPRLWRQLLARVASANRPGLELGAAVAVSLYLVGIGAAAAAVHPVLSHWSASQRQIREVIVRHVGDVPVVTNLHATRKFLPLLDLKFEPHNRLSIDQLATLIERNGEFCLVLIDRSDSEFWRADARVNQEFLAALEPPPELLFDQQMNATDRLRIWRVREVHRPASRNESDAARDRADASHAPGSPTPP
jgi:hypothetical protein